VISPWTVGRFSDDKGADDFGRLRLVRDVRIPVAAPAGIVL
jgi:hypothetical protein